MDFTTLDVSFGNVKVKLLRVVALTTFMLIRAFFPSFRSWRLAGGRRRRRWEEQAQLV